MPCRDYNDDITYRCADKDKKIDKLTRMLCYLCEEVSRISFDFLIDDNKELKNWCIEHKEQDRKRLLAEKKEREKKNLRKSALSKLSKEEKEALGLR